MCWLQFTEQEDRREQICEAHERTFRWIFDSGDPRGLATWLQKENGLYWISGKAGSGKSTLMKYLTDDGWFRDLLLDWAGEYDLHTASYYFWRAGTLLQKSVVGLYRTLLWHLLRRESSLCRRMASPDWQTKFVREEPTPEYVVAAMKKLLNSGSLRARNCFAIDGLDEFDQGSIVQRKLAQSMLDLVATGHVKIVLSSRLESMFEAAFRNSPHMRLQDLTGDDIDEYTDSRLSNLLMSLGTGVLSREEARRIVEYVIDHAQGVFLWVRIAMDTVLDGVDNSEASHKIYVGLSALPSEPEGLFMHVLTKRIRPQVKAEAFRYLWLVLVSTRGLRYYGHIPALDLATAVRVSDFRICL